MLRNVRNKVVCWVLLVGWFSAQSLAAAEKVPVGKVAGSPAASLNGSAFSDVTTIAAGDLLSTPKGGGALVNSRSGTRISLSGETAVRFENASGRVVAQILAGTVLVDSSGKSIPLVETPKYKIEPAQQGKVTYLVGLLPDKRTVVAARHGKVSITEISSGQSYLLGDGRYATIADSSSGVPLQEALPTKPATQQASAASVAALGVGVGGVIAAWQIGTLPAGSSLTVPGVVASPTARTSTETQAASRPKPSPH
jgi:hypothetical protein